MATKWIEARAPSVVLVHDRPNDESQPADEGEDEASDGHHDYEVRGRFNERLAEILSRRGRRDRA